MDNIEYLDNSRIIKITLPTTKTKIVRKFIIDEGDNPELNLIQNFKRYASLRPDNVPVKRFFLCYRNGKCTPQEIGVHTIGGYPQRIATFLKLANPKEFTGHCFRRTSASLLADSGVDISILKRHGGWLSDRVLVRYWA